MKNSYKWSGKIGLSTLAAEVKDVALVGEQIVGRWGNELWHRVSVPSRRTIVEQFVNWPNDSQGIRGFTAKYGPLAMPQVGAKFEQSVKEWQAHQAWLRQHWSLDSPLSRKIGMAEADMLEIAPEKLSLSVGSLERFLEFEIWLSPLTRRRICKRPDCETPYFIANPKQRFCDERCAEWGQQQHKQKWWRQHGPAWREQRARKTRVSPKKSRSKGVRARG